MMKAPNSKFISTIGATEYILYTALGFCFTFLLAFSFSQHLEDVYARPGVSRPKTGNSTAVLCGASSPAYKLRMIIYDISI